VSISHQPVGEVYAIDAALRDRAAIAVVVDGHASYRAARDEVGQFIGSALATPVVIAAQLAALRRVDAEQTNASAVDFERVASMPLARPVRSAAYAIVPATKATAQDRIHLRLAVIVDGDGWLTHSLHICLGEFVIKIYPTSSKQPNIEDAAPRADWRRAAQEVPQQGERVHAPSTFAEEREARDLHPDCHR
jgi:hypothetical protein